MKTSINHIVGLFLLVLLYGCNSHEERQTNHITGTPAEKFMVVKTSEGSFMKDGIYESWYLDGSRNQSGTYENGEKQGEWKEWYPNGQIKIQANYNKGKLDGKHTTWYESGQVWGEGTMKDGNRVGTYVVYFENGKVGTSESYDQEGKPTGEFKGFDVNGNLTKLRTYVNGVDTDLPATYADNNRSLKLTPDGNYEYTESRYNIYKKGAFVVTQGTMDMVGFKKITLLKYTSDEIAWKDVFDVPQLKRQK